MSVCVIMHRSPASVNNENAIMFCQNCVTLSVKISLFNRRIRLIFAERVTNVGIETSQSISCEFK